MICAQDVFEDQQVFVSQGLGGLGEILDGDGVGADFGLGKDGSELHGFGSYQLARCRLISDQS